MKPQQWRRSFAGRYLRHLPRIKHLRGTWLHRRLGDRFFASEMWHPDRERFAGGVAIGAFFGMIPFPLQMMSAAVIAYVTRVNIPTAIAATWLSNPFTMPVIIYLQYKVGCLLLGKPPVDSFFKGDPLEILKTLFANAPLPLLAGSVVVGAAASLICYPLALAAYSFVSRHILKPKPRHTIMRDRKSISVGKPLSK